MKKIISKNLFRLAILYIILFITSPNIYAQQARPLTRYTYIDETPMSWILKEHYDNGYIVFRTNYLDLVMQQTIPSIEDVNQTLRAFASLGEYEPVSFAIRALKNLEDVSISVSPLKNQSGSLISPDWIEIRSVRFLPEKYFSFDNRMMDVPVILEKHDKIKITEYQTQPYWIIIKVPENAQGGYYKGKLTISAKGYKSTDIELILEVLPFKLDPVPSQIALGMYDRVGDSDDKELLYKFQDMKDHGLNTVGLAANLGCEITRNGDQVNIDFQGKGDLERTIQIYKKVGMNGNLHWLMGADVRDWATREAGGMDKPKFDVYYRNAVKAVIDHGKKNNWPFMVIQPDDEAFEHRDRWESMVYCMKALRPLVPETLIEADGMNGDSTGLRSVLDLIDVLNYHDGPFLKRGVYDGPGWKKFKAELDAKGKQIWYYNVDHTGYHPEAGRFSFGFMVWENNVPGMFNWLLYKGGRKDPYQGANDLNGYNWMYRFLPTDKEVGGPTTQWEAIREGVDDLRYLYTWKALADKAKKSGNSDLVKWIKGTEVELQSWMDEIDYSKWNKGPYRGKWTTTDPESKIFKGKFKMQGVWELDRYNYMRRQIADWIMKLQTSV